MKNVQNIVELADGVYWLGMRTDSRLEINAYLRSFTGKNKVTNMIIDPGPPVIFDVLHERVKGLTGDPRKVHMAYINHPLVGDPVYGGRFKIPAGQNQALKQFLHDFKRQALHARKLGLTHPHSGAWMSWEAEPPEDMLQLTELLKEYTQQPL